MTEDDAAEHGASEHDAAADFVKRYEAFWRNGAQDLDTIYTSNAILCGYEIVKSREHIAPILAGIIAQGWREIRIEIIESSVIDDAILIACRYTARSETDEMTAKSSYVLVQDAGSWRAAMHTAT